jgi:hypothetical protein
MGLVPPKKRQTSTLSRSSGIAVLHLARLRLEAASILPQLSARSIGGNASVALSPCGSKNSLATDRELSYVLAFAISRNPITHCLYYL